MNKLRGVYYINVQLKYSKVWTIKTIMSILSIVYNHTQYTYMCLYKTQTIRLEYAFSDSQFSPNNIDFNMFKHILHFYGFCLIIERYKTYKLNSPVYILYIYACDHKTSI